MSDHTIMVIQVIQTFLYSSSVYSCHLFLIPSASVSSLLFLSFIMPILALYVPLISPIVLKRCLVFPILLFPSISLLCSFKKAFLSLLAILSNSASVGSIFLFLPCLLLLFFPQQFVKPPQGTTLPSSFLFFRMALVIVSCKML